MKLTYKLGSKSWGASNRLSGGWIARAPVMVGISEGL